ncbi:Tigger transposable element-derived protein 4, partial [Dictyocoela muelleri]
LNKRSNLSNLEDKYSDIDSYLSEKIRILREKKIPVSQKTIFDLALEYKKIRGDEEIKITDYFVKKFVKRQSLSYITLHGEAASADIGLIDVFKQDLSKKLETYEKQDIFNIEETSLYIKSCSNKSYVLDKKKDNRGTKQDKTRITLMLGVNPFREKLTPLLIGKSQNPRVFKNIDLNSFNIMYRANKSSWLTSGLFNEYLDLLNEKLKEKDRKILLIVDNFSGHKVRKRPT